MQSLQNMQYIDSSKSRLILQEKVLACGGSCSSCCIVLTGPGDLIQIAA